MFQTCRRVGIVGLVFASIWAFMTVMNNFVIRLFSDLMDTLYPYPGNVIGVAGVASSLFMVYLARKIGDKPQLLIDVGAGYLVLQCLLISLLTHWIPIPLVPRVSWVCVAFSVVM